MPTARRYRLEQRTPQTLVRFVLRPPSGVLVGPAIDRLHRLQVLRHGLPLATATVRLAPSPAGGKSLQTAFRRIMRGNAANVSGPQRHSYRFNNIHSKSQASVL